MSLVAELRTLETGLERLAATLTGPGLQRVTRAQIALETLRLRLRDPQIERALVAWLALSSLLHELRSQAQPDDEELVQMVQQHGVRGAARRLGISKTTVSRRLKSVPRDTKTGLDPSHLRSDSYATSHHDVPPSVDHDR